MFRVLKLLRIPRLFELLDVEKFKGILSMYYTAQLETAVAQEDFSYHYPILKQMKMIYMYRLLQIVVIIISCSYFLAIFWRIYVQDIIDYENWDVYDVYNGKDCFFSKPDFGFIDEDGVEELKVIQTIKLVYYALTTLSTVGYGDFLP